MEKRRRRAVASANDQLRYVLRGPDQARYVDAANFMRRGDATNSAKNERTNDTAYPCCPDVVGAAICIVRIEFPARAARDGAAPVIAVCAFDFGLTVCSCRQP